MVDFQTYHQKASKAREAKRANWPYFNVEWERTAVLQDGPLQGDKTVEDTMG